MPCTYLHSLQIYFSAITMKKKNMCFLPSHSFSICLLPCMCACLFFISTYTLDNNNNTIYRYIHTVSRQACKLSGIPLSFLSISSFSFPAIIFTHFFQYSSSVPFIIHTWLSSASSLGFVFSFSVSLLLSYPSVHVLCTCMCQCVCAVFTLCLFFLKNWIIYLSFR